MHGNAPLAAAIVLDARTDDELSQDSADVDPWPCTSLSDLVNGETFALRLEFFARNSNPYDVSMKEFRLRLERQFRFIPLFGMPVKKQTNPFQRFKILRLYA
jgi:hypothetical protein